MSAQLARRLARSQLFLSNVLFLAGSLAAGLFGYMFQFLAGRLLGPGGYGVVASAFAFYNILAISLLVVLTITTRHAAALHGSGNEPGLRHLFHRLTLAALGAGAAAGVAYLGLTSSLAAFLKIPPAALLALAPAVALTLVVGVNRGMLQGQGQFGWLSGVLTVEAAGRAVLAGLLVGAGLGSAGALGAVSLATVAAYLLGLVPLRRLLRRRPIDPVRMKEVAAFALPAVMAVAGITFLYNADIVLVSHFMSDRAGVYASGATLGRIVYFATFSITGVMFPNVSALVARGESGVRTLQLSALAMVGIAGTIVVGFAILPNLALLPFGPRFKAAAPYLPAFALAMGFLSVANLLVNYLLALGNRTFGLVLGAACLLEGLLLALFHQSLAQVVTVLVLVCAFAAGGQAILYLRLTNRQVPAGGTVSTGRNT
ncbi:MAG: hypothetical protein NVSMB17_01560 [Candidatus Dormibacteria bacterium]